MSYAKREEVVSKAALPAGAVKITEEKTRSQRTREETQPKGPCLSPFPERRRDLCRTCCR